MPEVPVATDDEDLTLPWETPAEPDFFTRVYGSAHGWLCLWTKRDKRSAWFHYPEQAAEALRYSRDHADTDDVYYGVCLYRESLDAAHRGTAKEATVLPALFLDIDVTDGSAHKSADLPGSMEEAQRFLAELPLHPSFTIDSGHGIHAYWLLEEPIGIDAASLERMTRTMKAWNEAINHRAGELGWKFDVVCEPARVLRVPGTVNHKDGKKTPVGEPDGSWRRVSIAEVQSAYKAMTAMQPGPAMDEPFRLPKRVAEGARNRTLYQYACSLRAKEQGPDEVLDAVLDANRKLCRPPLPDSECRTIAHSACTHPPGPTTQSSSTNAPTASDSRSKQKDFGHATVLQQLLSGRYRWATHRGSWMEYTGQVWQAIPEERMAVVATETMLQHYTLLMDAQKEEGARREWARKVQEACTFSRVMSALSYLKGLAGVLTRPEEWDVDPWLLNIANGTLDLKTGQLRQHELDDLLTKLAPVRYDPQAKGANWDEHLRMFLPNENVRRSVKRALGVALVGTTLEEKLDFWFGSGANGKTTTARILMDVLGEYVKRAAPDLLIATRNERHPTEIADLAGARLVFSVEVAEGRKLAEALVKDLTGGDRKKARYMREDFFEFEQTFSIVLIANHKPGITGNDEGIWRRIRLIPWESRVSPEKRKTQEEVLDLLREDGSAILNWLLEGLEDWQRDHSWTAEEVQAATDVYRQEQDVLGGFITDKCELGQKNTCSVAELYTGYEGWCVEADEPAVSKKMFGTLLRGRGFVQVRVGDRNQRKWKGIRLKAPLEAGLEG